MEDKERCNGNPVRTQQSNSGVASDTPGSSEDTALEEWEQQVEVAKPSEQGNRAVYGRGERGPGVESRLEKDAMIAAVSAVIAMSFSDGARWVLWLACCAVIVVVPARRWGRWSWTSWDRPPLLEGGEQGTRVGQDADAVTDTRSVGDGNEPVELDDHLMARAVDAKPVGGGVCGGAKAGEVWEGVAEDEELYREVSVRL